MRQKEKAAVNFTVEDRTVRTQTVRIDLRDLPERDWAGMTYMGRRVQLTEAVFRIVQTDEEKPHVNRLSIFGNLIRKDGSRSNVDVDASVWPGWEDPARPAGSTFRIEEREFADVVARAREALAEVLPA